MENNLNQVSTEPTPSAPTTPAKSSGTRDVFINIATMLSLGVMISSFVMLIQLLLDTLMPDKFNCECNYTEDITTYVASLIVSAIFYFYLSRKMRKDENALPLHHSNKFHQVIVYLALLLSAISISYSLIDVLQTTFYYGLTLAVFIKFGLIVLIFGSVFGYYLMDVKKAGDFVHAKLAIVFWWIVLALIVGSIIGSFLVIGSPAFQKEKRFDEERLADLKWIKEDFDYYYDEPLPEKLSDIYDEETMNSLLDPKYNQPYEYTKTGENTYDLCATFGTSSNDYAVKLKRLYKENAKNTVDPWAHEAGRTCFQLKVTPYEDYGYEEFYEESDDSIPMFPVDDSISTEEVSE